jgi:HTH-type transcriptional regulator / antitoxin HipB
MSFLIQTPSQLAAHLRALRIAKGWSQAQLGAKLGLSQARIARIEKDPLNVSVGQFLTVLSILDARVSVSADAKDASVGLSGAGSPGKGNAAKSNQGDW